MTAGRPPVRTAGMLELLVKTGRTAKVSNDRNTLYSSPRRSYQADQPPSTGSTAPVT